MEKKERKGKFEVVYLTDDCAYHLQKYLSTREDNNPALFVSNKHPHTRLGKAGDSIHAPDFRQQDRDSCSSAQVPANITYGCW